MPISDYEIDKILRGVRERQRNWEYYENRNKLSLSHSDALHSSRDERSMKKYNEMMELWRKDSELISK